jgi:hypothetical protein
MRKKKRTEEDGGFKKEDRKISCLPIYITTQIMNSDGKYFSQCIRGITMHRRGPSTSSNITTKSTSPF